MQDEKDLQVEVLPPCGSLPLERPRDKNVSPRIKARDREIQRFHGAPSLMDKIGGIENAEKATIALIQELIGETDSLLGNRELAQSDGNIRDASVISSKRAEALERVLKALQAKREFEKESGIDVDSPSVLVIYTHFMKKANEAFANSGLGREISDLFFRQLSQSLANWKADLKKEFADINDSKSRR